MQYIDNYPNLYRSPARRPPYELYGDPDMYLKWRGPLREATRRQVLEILAPVYGPMLIENGYQLDDALNETKMWALAFGSGTAHRVHGHNLLEMADIFAASLNLNAIHEEAVSMPAKMAQFVIARKKPQPPGCTRWRIWMICKFPKTSPRLRHSKYRQRRRAQSFPIGLIIAALFVFELRGKHAGRYLGR